MNTGSPDAPKPSTQDQPRPGDETSPHASQTAENTCRRCKGSGRSENGQSCPECDGTGRVTVTVGDA
ncbi:hypothetical protein [Caldimonas brevitalea]|uniref:hypothetical protein n=1 Tax=Caldimonas brevitalea TaxID=413882 RepID=UPI0009FA71E7|nr:hypothetical protein [Caldimonas brevitalea]